MKTRIKNYLSVTKTEWNGLVVLVLLILIVLSAPAIYRQLNHDKPTDFKKLELAAAELKRAGVTAEDPGNEFNKDEGAELLTLSKFNPNNLSVDAWRKLGLTLGQIKGIKNYEAKGGQFHIKADVKKMYTLSDEDYKRLEPYINLPDKPVSTDKKYHLIMEVNTADSATFTHLNGIGPAYARRIIQYRTKLGGFHSKQQLKEVYGIDDMLYRDIQLHLTVNPKKLKRININTAEYDDLKNFPYLSYKQINAIIQYRNQHGYYETFDELSNIAILNSVVLKKVKPYFVLR